MLSQTVSSLFLSSSNIFSLFFTLRSWSCLLFHWKKKKPKKPEKQKTNYSLADFSNSSKGKFFSHKYIGQNPWCQDRPTSLFNNPYPICQQVQLALQNLIICTTITMLQQEVSISLWFDNLKWIIDLPVSTLAPLHFLSLDQLRCLLSPFLTKCHPHESRNFFCFCSLLFSQHLIQCLEHSKHSKQYYLKELTNLWAHCQTRTSAYQLLYFLCLIHCQAKSGCSKYICLMIPEVSGE